MYDTQDPDYDDIQLAQIEEQQLEAMVTELVEYVIFLRDAAANLRVEVNALSHRIDPQAPPVYYEIYADLCRTLEDISIYPRFKKQLDRLIYE